MFIPKTFFSLEDSTLEIQTHPAGTRIVLNKPLNERGKYLYLVHVIAFLVPAPFYGYALFAGGDSIVAFLVSTGTFVIYILVAVRYFNSAFRREEIWVTDADIEPF
jgi:hypothetical protein